MRIFIDPGFVDRAVERGFDGASPFALAHLPVPPSEKTAFLREGMYAWLRRNPLFDSVAEPDAADAVFMPFNLGKVRAERPDIEGHYRGLAEKAGRPLLIDYFGDATDDVDGEGVLVLRTSKYRDRVRANEIICPPVIEDIGAQYGIEPLPKPDTPSIGFVGLADKRRAAGWVSRLIPYSRHDYALTALSWLGSQRGRERSGIYFRKRALQAFEKDPNIATDFLVRRFWGRGKRARNVIGAEQMRDDYIENMRRNPYLLAVRGRGNFSLRFFEILSAGRIPVAIDTATPLPLEDTADYVRCCLFTDWRELGSAPARLSAFHRATSESEMQSMQIAARELFQRYLRFDVFSRDLFDHLLPERLGARTEAPVHDVCEARGVE
ncbi:hypothetical protein V6X62_02720 [Spiribacter sp. 218]|uniref:hypothetical protein n=1 Tax=Spiribacter pallidus TaxID=1987936 RepID=UPI00349F2B01